jgi:hypothetical protein
MTEQSPSPTHAAQDQHAQPARDSKRTLHRVCIQCNQLFVVAPENYDAKQCPGCHKG